MSATQGSTRRYASPQRSRYETSHRQEYATTRDDRHDPQIRHQNSHHHRPLASSVTSESAAASWHEPRRRRTWPPQPYVEDEEDVIRRETGWSRRRARQYLRDKIPFQGSIDQEPVLEEVQPRPPTASQASLDSKASQKGSRRPSPKSRGEDEQTRRRQPSPTGRISKVSDVVPEMRDRRSSPYTFSKKDQFDSNILDLERTRSPETFVNPSDASKKPILRSGLNSDSRSIPPEPLQRAHSMKDEPYHASLSQSLEQMNIGGRNDQHQRPSERRNEDRNKPRDSVLGSTDGRQLPLRRDQSDPNDHSFQHHTTLQPRRSCTFDHDPERNRYNVPPEAVDNFYKPTTSSFIRPPSFIAQGDVNAKSHRHNEIEPRAGTSEVVNSYTRRTPSRSPRASGEFASGISATGSLNSSHGRSRAPSPALITDSHMITNMPYVDFEQDTLLSNLFPANPNVLYDFTPGLGRSDTFSSQASSLPYPEEDTMTGPWIEMPSEPELEWRPETGYIARGPDTVESSSSRILQTEATIVTAPPRPPTLTANLPPLHRMSSGATTAPSLNRTHSSATEYNRIEGHQPTAKNAPTNYAPDYRAARPPSRRADNSRDFDDGLSQYERLVKAVRHKPPHCPRQYAKAGTADWKTVRGAPTVHFCPECIAPMRGTPFMEHLKPFQLPHRDARIKCAFELPWMVRAWSATHSAELTDFSTLKFVANTDDCTANTRGDPLHVAWGIKAPPEYRQSFIPSFHLCHEDYKKVKDLLPRLKPLFGEKSVKDGDHFCSVHTESSGFREYWTALEAISNTIKVNQVADLTPLITAIERKRRSQEDARRNRAY